MSGCAGSTSVGSAVGRPLESCDSESSAILALLAARAALIFFLFFGILVKSVICLLTPRTASSLTWISSLIGANTASSTVSGVLTSRS